jgi:hypothetical protein
MSESISSKHLFSHWSAQAWRRFASVACGVCCATFLAGTALFLFSPAHGSGGPALNGTALSLAFIATLCGGAGIFGFNRYAALNADDQFIALWTNLLCRVMAMVELLSFAAVLAWLIIHFIGVPTFNHFHH